MSERNLWASFFRAHQRIAGRACSSHPAPGGLRSGRRHGRARCSPRQRPPESRWNDCYGSAALKLRAADPGRRTLDVGLPASDLRPWGRNLRSGGRGPTPEVRLLTPGWSRHCVLPICSCKAGDLGWWRSISEMCRIRQRGVFLWRRGFAFSVRSSLPPQYCWSWPRCLALRLALLC